MVVHGQNSNHRFTLLFFRTEKTKKKEGGPPTWDMQPILGYLSQFPYQLQLCSTTPVCRRSAWHARAFPTNHSGRDGLLPGLASEYPHHRPESAAGMPVLRK